MVKINMEIIKPLDWYRDVAKTHGLKSAIHAVALLEAATGWKWSIGRGSIVGQ